MANRFGGHVRYRISTHRYYIACMWHVITVGQGICLFWLVRQWCTKLTLLLPWNCFQYAFVVIGVYQLHICVEWCNSYLTLGIPLDGAAVTACCQRHLDVPYVGGLTKKLQRIYRKQHISTAVSPHRTLRSFLVHPKDNIEDHKNSGVVYSFLAKIVKPTILVKLVVPLEYAQRNIRKKPRKPQLTITPGQWDVL